MVFRLDIGTLNPPQRLDDGRIIVQGTLTRTGVFTYRNADGSVRREYRPPAEVFDPASLASFRFVPVTNDHPPDMVTAANAGKYAVGQVGEDVRVDGIHVAATFVVNDLATIEAMDKGKRELSCGYNCKLIEVPGVSPEGEHYDAMQTKIRGNHLAIVAVGRAGSARVRMDGAFQVDAASATSNKPTSKDNQFMDLEKALAALTAANETNGNLKAKLDASDAAAKALEMRLTAAEAEVSAANTQRDAAKADAAKADAAKNDAADKFDAAVADRVLVIAAAEKHLRTDGKPDDVKALSNRAIKVAVVKKIDGREIEATRSDDAVNYAFELAMARMDQAADSVRAVHGALRTGAKTVVTDESKMRKDCENSLSEQWRTVEAK